MAPVVLAASVPRALHLAHLAALSDLAVQAEGVALAGASAAPEWGLGASAEAELEEDASPRGECLEGEEEEEEDG
jgi:hypothetical protein